MSVEHDMVTKLTKIKIPSEKKGEKAIEVKLDSSINAKVEIYELNWPDVRELSANVNALNKTSKTMKFSYFIAFYDKDKNLVACTQASYEVEPSKENRAFPFHASATIPEDFMDTIEYYQIRYYEYEMK